MMSITHLRGEPVGERRVEARLCPGRQPSNRGPLIIRRPMHPYKKRHREKIYCVKRRGRFSGSGAPDRLGAPRRGRPRRTRGRPAASRLYEGCAVITPHSPSSVWIIPIGSEDGSAQWQAALVRAPIEAQRAAISPTTYRLARRQASVWAASGPPAPSPGSPKFTLFVDAARDASSAAARARPCPASTT